MSDDESNSPMLQTLATSTYEINSKLIEADSRLDYSGIYCIAQNGGRGKLWRINCFGVMAGKTLMNLNFNL